jgi:signal transduction histidine kinase
VGRQENPPWLMTSAAPLSTEQSIYGAVMVFTDITRLRQVEDELRSYQDHLEDLVAERTRALEANQQRLRALAADLTLAEQHERQRLAGVVHDEIAQTLGVLKLQLSVLRADDAARPLEDRLTQVITMVDEAIRQSRTIMMELSPPILRQAGLVEALQWWAQQVQEKHGLEVVVTVEGETQRLDEDLEATIFQTVKELIQNTVKHAHATRLAVRMQCGHGKLSVEVADDGVGFDPSATRYTAGGGFGLYGIRERLAYLGGDLQIDSAPGKGTRIALHLPQHCLVHPNHEEQAPAPVAR